LRPAPRARVPALTGATDEPTWHHRRVDPALADRTRQRLWRELEGDDITGAGAHFPELKFGRVLRGSGKRWWT